MRFELARFGDHLKLVKGASYSSKNLVKESDTGLLTINAFHVGGGYKPQSEKPFQGEVREEHSLTDGDVLLAMTEQDEGLLASPLIVRKAQTNYEHLLFSLDVAKPIATTGEIEPEFVFNVLRIPAFRKRAAYGDTGSTVQRLPYDALGDFRMPMPPLKVQRAINRIAALIDQKIWLNGRMSDTLENLSASKFRSWFIDFDAVKAKMAGQAPVGMDAETAALFPDSMEESELGLVPRGWRMRLLTDLASIRYGAAFSSKKFNSHGLGLPLIRIRDLRTQSPSIYTDEDIPRGFAARAGSLLLGMDGEFEPVIWFGEDAWVNQRVCMVQPKEDCDASFLQFHLKPILKKIEHGTVGTTVLHLGKSELDSISILYPSRELISAYAKISSAILELRISLTKESIYLRRLRDALLPRLVSGELEIPEEMLAA